jgi:lipoprotein-releasing system permease protein
MNGLQRDLREKILIGSPDIRVLSPSTDWKIVDWESVLSEVRKDPDIVAAGPFVQTEALLKGEGSYATGAQIVGLPHDTAGLQEPTTIRKKAARGDFSFKDPKGERLGIVLGSKLAQRLHVSPGMELSAGTLALLNVNPITGLPSFKGIPRVTVTSLIETGMYEYDNSYAYVDIDLARELAGIGNAVTGIEAKLKNRDRAREVADRLFEKFDHRYDVEDFERANSSLFNALRLEKFGMTVILFLIVMVAAFNIVSTLTMVVRDKTREIGILKAMGLPAASVRRVFFAQGLVIGLVGTALGVALGVLIGWSVDYYHLIPLEASVYFIDHLPVDVNPADVFSIMVASLSIAALATIYPATQAAGLYPIEAIRHE